MKHKNKRLNPSKEEVLIALAAQESEPVEQQPSPQELTEFFANPKSFSNKRQEQILAYLDSAPQAYDRWIRYGRETTQPKRAPFLFSRPLYIAATCILLFMGGVSFFLFNQSFQINQAIDHAYQSAAVRDNDGRLELKVIAFTDTIQPTEGPLAFSQSGQLSDLAQAFILGLQNSSQQQADTSSGSVQPEDYQLGRWHTLLWTVSQQKRALTQAFWQEQLLIQDHLQAHYADRLKSSGADDVRAIALQLERLRPVLQQLAENSQNTRTYQNIEEILTALHYSLIPWKRS